MLEIKRIDLEKEHRDKAMDLKTQLIEEASSGVVSIELRIRTRYSMSQELALHRKKLMGKLEDSEWNDYCAFVQECIDEVETTLDAE